jgi:Tat protein secretion system quality control protein TatD with DNase activity
MYIPGNEQKDKNEPKSLVGDEKLKHYQDVLRPARTELSDDDRRIFLSLPDPMPFSTFISKTREYLEKYPYSLIGEIGLDRSFRIPEASESQESRDESLTPGGREGRRLTPFRVDLAHQKKIVKQQLQLAAEMDRAVSMHGVQAHGVVFEVIKELYQGHEKKVLSKREKKKRGTDHSSVPIDENSIDETRQEKSRTYPPRICLHSYSGNPSSFKQYLDLSIPVEIFASFSTAINVSEDLDGETPKTFEEMIMTVPDHMLLVESDLHTAGERMDIYMEDIVRRICKIKGWGLEDGVKRLGDNWRRFIFG